MRLPGQVLTRQACFNGSRLYGRGREFVISQSDTSSEGAPAWFRYWGKAGPADSGVFHLLPFHCLDVAAVGRALLEANPALCRHLAALSGLEEAQFLCWAPFFLALHDLGKFADAFQNLRPDLRERLLRRTCRRPYHTRHDTLGYLLWREVLKEVAREQGILPPAPQGRRRRGADGVDFWLRAVTGHHGLPPKTGDLVLRDHFEKPGDIEAATGFLDALQALLLAGAGPLPALDREPMKRASWWLAGFTVLCDWLGSGRDPDSYRSTPVPLDAYWEQALPWAQGQVHQRGLLPARASSRFDLADCLPGLPHDALTATPLQAAVSALELTRGPQLFLLEDVTGAGKTEAALLLAHRLMAQGEGGGLYFGLPTMATSNAMYERLGMVYRRLFAPQPEPSLVLAHSARALSEPFRASYGAEPDYGKDEAAPAGAHCAAWLADNRKKALLAHAGVGTVDQALLAVLPARHQSLRLLGLLGKVLIVDEVHACDAYMNKLLCGLLRAHAATGGSAILLSATLPAGQRRTLIDAFSAGAGEPVEADIPPDAAYPLLTRVGGGRLHTRAVETPERVRRRVRVETIESEQEVVEALLADARAGRCACWIRNTVDDARRAWRRLRDHLPAGQVHLFHARFALADRLAIEKRVLRCFGPDSGPDERRGQILIATQVVEQSLDLDFDHMVSDLAPIDLLIQRAGRLCRHPRDGEGRRIGGPDARGEPRLTLLTPPWTDQPGPRWLKDALAGTAAVYRDMDGQLWLGLRLLREKGGFRMPEDARELIEGVYGDDALDDMPDALQESALAQEGERMAQDSQAALNLLSIDQGYSREGSNIWWDEANTPTRLGDPMTTVYLARWEDGQLTPWWGQGMTGWMQSSVSLRQSLVYETGRYDEIPDSVIESARETLPGKGRWGVLLPLVRASEGWWKGRAVTKSGQRVELQYNGYEGIQGS